MFLFLSRSFYRQLLRDPNVIFGGYKVPHPLENHIEVKVQTNDNSTPNESMIACIKSLLRELDQIKESFNVYIYIYLISIFL